MTLTRRKALQLMGSTAVASFMSFAPAAMAQDAQRGGVLRLGFSADPAGFDPAQGPSGMSHIAIEQVYSTLMSLDPDAQPYPDLAESYEVADDGQTYTFVLREGVKFHDGSDLTAEDVKFSFDRLRAEDSGYSYKSQVETIDSIEVIDPRTVQFNLSVPTGPFLTYMAFPGSSIVPKALVESGHDLNAKPVGSGPFVFESYAPRSMIKFSRNDSFYEEGKPYVDAMEMHLISDVTALTNAIVSGTINFSNEIPAKDWSMVTSTPGLVGQSLAGSRYYWLLPNNTEAPMDNPKVRQAIAHAIDRDAIVRGAFFGQAVPTTGGVIPEWNWAHADLGYFTSGANPDKAKALLAEAGLEDGFETSITMGSAWSPMLSMAPIIQANLAAVGIKAKIKTVEVPRYWDEVWGPSNFDMTAMYWLSPLADPDDFVGANYNCGESINAQKSCDQDMTDILKRAKTAVTKEERKDLYRQQQELSLEQMPIIPLVNSYILTAHTDKLRGFTPMRTGFLKTLKDSWFAE